MLFMMIRKVAAKNPFRPKITLGTGLLLVLEGHQTAGGLAIIPLRLNLFVDRII